MYRTGLPPVLRHLNLSVRHGEKIGICGRTGAGKSSLSLLLFRLIEVGEEGTVLLDGVDLSRIGLQTLRSRLTIIPQVGLQHCVQSCGVPYAPAERADTLPPISSLSQYVLCGFSHKMFVGKPMKFKTVLHNIHKGAVV